MLPCGIPKLFILKGKVTAASINCGFINNANADLIRGIEIKGRVRHGMEPHAVCADFFAHLKPGAGILGSLLGRSHVMPGIPFEPDGNLIQQETRSFYPEFLETEAGEL